jgi:hypothetical protein
MAASATRLAPLLENWMDADSAATMAYKKAVWSAGKRAHWWVLWSADLRAHWKVLWSAGKMVHWKDVSSVDMKAA